MTPARSSELLPTPDAPYNSVRCDANRLATTTRWSRSRPKKKRASSSVYGTSPRYGEATLGEAMAGLRPDVLQELVDLELIDRQLRPLPELRFERLGAMLDRPRIVATRP